MPQPDFSDPKTISVAVLGAGALGCLYGGALAQAGCRVTLITRRKEHLEAINKNGLHIAGPGNSGKAGHNGPYSGDVITGIRAVKDLESAPQPDLLLLTVKSHGTKKAMEQAAQHIPAHCLVLTLQNGIGNIPIIYRHVPQARILGGVSYRGAFYAAPGSIRHTGRADTVIGTLLENQPHAENVRALFERVGLPCSVSKNIRGLLWTKLMVNIAINPLAALCRLSNGELALHAESTSIMRDIVAEAVAVAEAKGIRLEVEDPLEHALKIATATGPNKASMLQDVLSGRRTEIDFMNGAVVNEGQKLGLSTPANAMVTNMIRLLEKSYLRN